MLDLKFIRENPELVKTGSANKSMTCEVDKILTLDKERRDILHQVEELKASRNKASAEIAGKKKAGEPAEDAIAAMRRVGDEIASLDEKVRGVDKELNDLKVIHLGPALCHRNRLHEFFKFIREHWFGYVKTLHLITPKFFYQSQFGFSFNTFCHGIHV